MKDPRKQEQMKRVRRSSNPPTRPDDKRLHPKLGDGRGNPKKPVEIKKKGFQVAFAPELMAQIDEAAHVAGVSRSEWLASAARKVLEMEAVLKAEMTK